MYDSRQFTMAEIAATCSVTPNTVYRHIRTDQNKATIIFRTSGFDPLECFVDRLRARLVPGEIRPGRGDDVRPRGEH